MQEKMPAKENCSVYRRSIKAILLFSLLIGSSVLLILCTKEDLNSIALPDYNPTEKTEYNNTNTSTPTNDSIRLNSFDASIGAEVNTYYYRKIIHHSISENPREFAASEALHGVLLPGVLVKGSSVFSGIPTIIPCDNKRKKIKVSLSVFSGSGDPMSREVNAGQADIVQAINDILAGYTGGFPAQYNIETKLITSQEQLSCELKVGWSNPSNNLAAKTNFSYNKNKTSLLVTLTQSFFSITVDALSESNTFIDGKTPEEIAPYIKPEADGTPNPLAYISSVTYGRVYKIFMTTDEKNVDLKAAVDYAYKGAVNNISANAKINLQKRLNQISTQVYQIGGDASTGLATAFLKNPPDALDSIRSFIVGGANFSKTNVGAPLSYTVQTLKDNKIIKINNTLDYEEVEYVPARISSDPTKVIDIDGNIYPVVKIQNQTWMAENLRTSRLNNGDSIKLIVAPVSFVATAKAAYCGTRAANYGYLYNWYTVYTNNVCPVGWKVPYENDFTTLSYNLGGNTIAGQKLKIAGDSVWFTSAFVCTNESGFNAKGSGAISPAYNKMEGEKQVASYWVIERSGATSPAWSVTYNSNAFIRGVYPHTYGFSIRCIKN
jgi:uncharacterized protein (TIGR02145 family)